MELKVNNKQSFSVEEIIGKNLEIFYKLSAVGVKNINTAVDYYMILETYKKYDWIENFKERKEVVADQMKVSLKSVENALNLMKIFVEIRK